ncbi:DNA primase DnaG, partial [Halorubrum halodurans]|uniref:DNA primase DnaG n=1 Tax=Halorubrum halodurans TaxID=1383851 RepID=UPI001179CAFA
MNDTAKYLIRATIAADGVVERSDVVGAVFGQTEGLLGDELDLRDLQESSKVGRIDVEIRSENGQSFGEVTVASSLDKVETAILAASLETIDRIGPCGAAVEVTSIEDVRAAKRREVVERAKELVASGFEETSLASDDVLEEVRDAARVEGIVDYEGLPAGPRVGDSDAVIVVEGRADVSTLLECGIKNAVAVEGTNVPDAVAELTRSRTVTAFLDGDRGGELILRELAQVGEVDYVAFAPPGESVEDLDRGAIFEALRGKVPYETLADAPNLREAAGSVPEADADDGDAAAGAAEAADALRPDSSTEPPDPTGSDGASDADGPEETDDGSGEAAGDVDSASRSAADGSDDDDAGTAGTA